MTKKNSKDNSTEQKILQAAQKCFTEKGFAGTRTRDIADEAGINLALLNYYFRSKEKLFQQVMMGRMQLMFGTILPILMTEDTLLEDKIRLATNAYLDLLKDNPNLPLFIINEIHKESSEITGILPIEDVMKNSAMLKQIHDKNPHLNPLHFLMNFLSLTIFPFVTHPVFQKFGLLQSNEFETFIEERRKMIPVWMHQILNANPTNE